MALTGKKIKNSFKDILQMDNGNSGLTSSAARVFTGKGDMSAALLSTNHLQVKPTADSTTSFVVQDPSANAALTVDTTNRRVTGGANAYKMNTAVKEFALYDFTPTAGYHTPMLNGPMMPSASGTANFAHNANFGSNGADPVTTLDFSAVTPVTASKSVMPTMWYIPCAITVEEVYVYVFCEGTDTFNFHLMSYSIEQGLSNQGDLTAGAVVFYNGSTITGSSTQIKNTSLTLSSADVAASRALFLFIESSGTAQFSAYATVKYYLQ